MKIAAHTLTEDVGSEQIYNAFDCCLTYEIFSALSTNKNLTAASPAYSFERALQGPVLEMMLRGFRISPSARDSAIQKVKLDLERLDYILQQLSNALWGRDINPNSGPQLKSLFYNFVGIEPIKTWVKGEVKIQMNREVLERLEDYFIIRPIVNTILSHRDLEKQLQILLMEVDSDWRMRTTYNIGGTKTGRFSSSKSPETTGGNLQNVAEELRHIFIPDEGYVLAGIDASQSDSRMVGFMCGLIFNDWTYLDACESGDLHTTVAKMVWEDLPWTGNLKEDRKIAEKTFYRNIDYRKACKQIGHGANFFGKAPTLAKSSHVPLNLVKSFIEKYFAKFPAIRNWQSWAATELQTKKQLVSIHGRRRDFFDRVEADETLRKGLAFLAASATADNLDLGMWKIWKHMPEVQLLAQVHDAVYFQFKKTEDFDKIIKKAQKLLELPITAPNGRVFIVPTDVKLGYNWGDYNETTNPLGLKKFVAK